MRKETIIQVLHIFSLASLAFAQPLFDILSRNATFFVANHYKTIDIYLLVAGLCIGIPFIWALISLVLKKINGTLGLIVHLLQIAALVSIILLPFGKKIPGLPGILLIIACLAGGIIYAVGYRRSRHVQSFTTALSPAIIIVPVLFLFLSPVSKLVFKAQTVSAGSQEIHSATPVVVVIFDEFSLVSLLDETHNIDSIRYPHFAALAHDAYWFRNATTVAGQTERAVPAILTGMRPKLSAAPLPILSEYPNNLFTLLGKTYKMKVGESQTFLCPPELGGSLEEGLPLTHRLRALVTDLRIIFFHLVLPAEYTTTLPSIEHTWGGFSSEVSTAAKNITDLDPKTQSKDQIQQAINARMSTYEYRRVKQWNAFLNVLGSSENSTLYFNHILLPHYYWKFLPSGKSYIADEDQSPIPGLRGEDWTDDDWAVLQANQRYLLQVEFVDKMVGQLMERLKEVDLYDDCLLVVAADHGVSFRPNDSRRFITETNYGDILPMPLFIKKPHQRTGVISDRNVETIDILPTIADVIGARIPWRVDGQSVFDSTQNERPLKLVFRVVESDVYHPYPQKLEELDAALQRHIQLFGSGKHGDDFYHIGDYRQLVGKQVNTLPVSSSPDFQVWIDNKEYYNAVDTSGEFFQAQLTGNLVNQPNAALTSLAVAVNGTIQAVTRTYKQTDGEFSAMLPERSLHEGHNDVEVLKIEAGKENIVLLRPRENINYTLSGTENTGFVIQGPGEKTYRVTNTGPEGSIDTIFIGQDRVSLWGWAADVTNSTLPEDLIVFVDNHFAYLGDVGNIQRTELAQQRHKEFLLKSGFQIVIMSNHTSGISPEQVRVFALYSSGTAYELPHYTPVKITPKKDTQAPAYTLTTEEDGREIIQTPGGRSYAIARKLFDGNVDTIYTTDNIVSVWGWAANINHALLPDTIAMFIDGKCWEASAPGSMERAELAVSYGKKFLAKSGFHSDITISKDATTSTEHVRVFALYSIGMADELNHHGEVEPLYIKARREEQAAAPEQIKQLRLSANLSVPIMHDALQGHLDMWKVVGNEIEVAGWAADILHGEIVDSVYVFVNNICAVALPTGLNRDEVAKGYHVPKIANCGFNKSFLASRLGNLNAASKVEFFAVSKKRNCASEIRYTYDFPYNH